MYRISLAFFYGLGAALRPLSTLTAGMKLSDVWSPLYQAQNELLGLLQTDWFFPAVKTSATPASRLYDTLKQVTDRNDLQDGEIDHFEAYGITKALADFDVVLRAELSNADSYFVSRKGGYDTTVLVSNAEQHFPASLGVKVAEAVADVRAAGQCLAFELSTAAGFHVFRAVETVVRRYWDAVTGLPRPSLSTLGTYVTELDRQNKGEIATREVLKQLGKLHRNPLIHPEIVLTLDEAISLFGMCHSCITAMLKEIPDPAPSPALGGLPPVPSLGTLSSASAAPSSQGQAASATTP